MRNYYKTIKLSHREKNRSNHLASLCNGGVEKGTLISDPSCFMEHLIGQKYLFSNFRCREICELKSFINWRRRCGSEGGWSSSRAARWRLMVARLSHYNYCLSSFDRVALQSGKCFPFSDSSAGEHFPRSNLHKREHGKGLRLGPNRRQRVRVMEE